MTNLFDYLNWGAIAIAALAYFVVGALWYSPLLFVKKWLAYLNIDPNAPDAKKGMAVMFGGSLIMMIVQAIAIAILAERLGIRGDGWMSGLKLGALTGCCFCATTIGINYFYEKKPIGLFLINAGYAVVGNIIAGVIICTWY
ncbi:MAG: DUF1761 domain-containing protein [Chitinophagaceae bacterium]|nr:DUF1761 domain-containing protein [Chitinophagaceae bacterium]